MSAYFTIPIPAGKLEALSAFWRSAGEHYGLGSKIALDSFDDPDRLVDCSGYVRHVVYHATKAAGNAVKMPDGSWNQREWVVKKGFKRSTVEACNLRDGVVRIAFLRPADGGGIGHVALVLNGRTIESHGGVGPDERAWGSCSWMKKTEVYCLTLPEGT